MARPLPLKYRKRQKPKPFYETTCIDQCGQNGICQALCDEIAAALCRVTGVCQSVRENRQLPNEELRMQ
jgi:hypothetical protein